MRAAQLRRGMRLAVALSARNDPGHASELVELLADIVQCAETEAAGSAVEAPRTFHAECPACAARLDVVSQPRRQAEPETAPAPHPATAAAPVASDQQGVPIPAAIDDPAAGARVGVSPLGVSPQRAPTPAAQEIAAGVPAEAKEKGSATTAATRAAVFWTAERYAAMRAQYSESGAPVTEIARALGTSVNEIYKRIKQLGIPLRSASAPAAPAAAPPAVAPVVAPVVGSPQAPAVVPAAARSKETWAALRLAAEVLDPAGHPVKRGGGDSVTLDGEPATPEEIIDAANKILLEYGEDPIELIGLAEAAE